MARGINPIASGSALHTQVMKTEALKQALDQVTVRRRDRRRPARRGEKPRQGAHLLVRAAPATPGTRATSAPSSGTSSTRGSRPGETMRVFPLSNWTELDVWHYIAAENIEVVPLYFAKKRPVVKRGGVWIMVDDERLPLEPGETPEMRLVRFRTLGCYPLTGAIEFEGRDGRGHRRRDAAAARTPSGKAG